MTVHDWRRIGTWTNRVPDYSDHDAPKAGHECHRCKRRVGPMLYFVRVEPCPVGIALPVFH